MRRLTGSFVGHATNVTLRVLRYECYATSATIRALRYEISDYMIITIQKEKKKINIEKTVIMKFIADLIKYANES